LPSVFSDYFFPFPSDKSGRDVGLVDNKDEEDLVEVLDAMCPLRALVSSRKKKNSSTTTLWRNVIQFDGDQI